MQIKDSLINLCATLFVDEYKNPIILTEIQKEIFYQSVKPTAMNIGIIAPTQYGKSLCFALGKLLRVATLPIKCKIVAPTKEKTRIIMDYIISHAFDNNLILSQLVYDSGRLEELKRSRNKDHLTFKRGGEIKILTADSINKKNVGRTLLGEGGDDIGLDESSLIDDDFYAMIFRMIGGRKNAVLTELGNPIKRNHFHKTMTENNKTLKIWIDFKIGLSEGRYTEEFIEEAKKLRFFNQLYESQFPDEMTVDESGYTDLLSYNQIDNAIKKSKLPNNPDMIEQLKVIRYKWNSGGKIQIEPKQDMKARGIDSPDIADAMSLTFYKLYSDTERVLGVDVAGGGCESVYVLRYNNKIDILDRDRINDTMVVAGKIKRFMQAISDDRPDTIIKAQNVGIDKTGLGKGICDRLKEQGLNINAVDNAESPEDVDYKFTSQGTKIKKQDFANRKAEMFWRMKEWICDELVVKQRSPVRWI